MTEMTATEFTKLMGYAPAQDDLERANCPDAGKPLHSACGVCPDHKVPRMKCLCVHNHPTPTRPEGQERDQ